MRLYYSLIPRSGMGMRLYHSLIPRSGMGMRLYHSLIPRSGMEVMVYLMPSEKCQKLCHSPEVVRNSCVELIARVYQFVPKVVSVDAILNLLESCIA